MSSNCKPTQTQQGTYNAGKTQPVNSYPGVKRTQSGSVSGSKGR